MNQATTKCPKSNEETKLNSVKNKKKGGDVECHLEEVLVGVGLVVGAEVLARASEEAGEEVLAQVLEEVGEEVLAQVLEEVGLVGVIPMQDPDLITPIMALA